MSSKVNLSKASVLVVDHDRYSTRVVAQILRGFGLGRHLTVNTLAAARRVLLAGEIDIVICEALLLDGNAEELVRWVRRLPSAPTKSIPIIVLTGDAQMANVARARDVGANSVVRKPVAPKVLLDHILRCTNVERPFVESDRFIGPDRRFKGREPSDGAGRRNTDTSTAS
jgi:CheY-like chemotaxis protein